MDKDKLSEPIALAEQRVAEARTQVLCEYAAAQAKLHRRVSSPVFIGAVVLGVVALGYLAFGRSKQRQSVCKGKPGAWWKAIKTAQVLIPLLMVIHSASKPARRSDTSVNRQPG